MTKFISSAEAASILGIDARHIRRLLETKQLKGEKVARNWIVAVDSLKKFQRHPTKGRPKASRV